VEAESFKDHGGWSPDTQFIESMDSPYLLAHGMGERVKDAATTVNFPNAGKHRVWVRTMDWVARWNAPDAPGNFQLPVDGKPLAETFDTKGKAWAWQDGGMIEIAKNEASLALHDLTGFAGRCDAIFFLRRTRLSPRRTRMTRTTRGAGRHSVFRKSPKEQYQKGAARA